MTTRSRASLTRRRFLGASAAAAGSLALPSPLARGPFAQTSDRARPGMPYGVQSGEVGPHEAVVWSATDRPARMLVEWATTDTLHRCPAAGGTSRAAGDGLYRQGGARRTCPPGRRSSIA